MIVKKYSNRRLYDTEASRYITLDELADRVRKGADVRVVDAATDADLTQATLAQVILEGRGAAHLLPVPLLLQLIRMQDDALAEFFGRYLTWALDAYLRTRQASGALSGWNPWLGETLSHLGRWAPMWPFGGQGAGRQGQAGAGHEPHPQGHESATQGHEPPPPAHEAVPHPQEPPRSGGPRAPTASTTGRSAAESAHEARSWRDRDDALRDEALAASHRAHEAAAFHERDLEWVDVEHAGRTQGQPPRSTESEIAALRRELAELRSALTTGPARVAKGSARAKASAPASAATDPEPTRARRKPAPRK